MKRARRKCLVQKQSFARLSKFKRCFRRLLNLYWNSVPPKTSKLYQQAFMAMAKYNTAKQSKIYHMGIKKN